MGERARRLALLVLVVALATATPGCLSFKAASVPDKFLEGPGGNGWERVENRSMSEPQSEWMGFKKEQVLVYQDRATDGRGYPGTLTVVTLRAISAYSPEALKDLIKEQVRSRAEAAGLAVGGDPVEGTRTLADGSSTQYFVYSANVTKAGFFTQKDAGAKLIGEVWNCEASRTSVVAIGFAQVSSRSTTAGLLLPGGSSGVKLDTWRELVADKDGAIEGIKGERGLIDHVTC